MPKQKTLYYLPTYGQLGNQLAVLAHLLAFALEYNFKIVYPYSDFFSRHLQLFQAKHKLFTVSRRFSNRRFSKMMTGFLKLIFLHRNVRAFQCLILNKEFIVEKEFNTSSQPDVIVVTDWLFRYYDGIKKHQDILRKELSFTSSSVAGAQLKWQSLQAKFSSHTFIGVHVRRGDYAEWLSGIYYYDNDVYYAWMMQMSQQVECPVFITCSNEELHFKNEENLDIVYMKGKPLDDLYILSQCRYIIGPPSTFSSWSAFLCDRYLYQPETKNEVMNLDSFNKYYL